MFIYSLCCCYYLALMLWELNSYNEIFNGSEYTFTGNAPFKNIHSFLLFNFMQKAKVFIIGNFGWKLNNLMFCFIRPCGVIAHLFIFITKKALKFETETNIERSWIRARKPSFGCIRCILLDLLSGSCLIHLRPKKCYFYE